MIDENNISEPKETNSPEAYGNDVPDTMQKVTDFLFSYADHQEDSFSNLQFQALDLEPHDVIWHDSCNSTSDVIKEYLLNAAKGSDSSINLLKPKVCISEEQIQGYGQKNRQWHSSKGNLHFTMYLPINDHVSQSSDMSRIDGKLALELGLALITMPILLPAKIQHNVKMGIKWPNDLCVLSKDSVTQKPVLNKFGGVLVEPLNIKQNGNIKMLGVIIGIGINIHDDIDGVDGEAITSVQNILGHDVSLVDLAAQTCFACQKALEKFIKHSGSLPVRFFSHDLLYDKSVYVKMPVGSDVKGMASGIHADGSLIVMKDVDYSENIYDGSVYLAD